ncbi:hypothetical protein NLA06_06250 [Desulfomicrobium sp. ZS1]|uniref:hypothetical protein n=1 Tax=Desulfomicrobium sp. ZS1 TaxID=2952228 RepID=UPI0020B279A8|nr:hypothetical protein [Desulfomicrobium sp. ZS1]UTF51487.1 hypothetical protein NLA06_06250 [Desulfomicrobium sp. ZS1]
MARLLSDRVLGAFTTSDGLWVGSVASGLSLPVMPWQNLQNLTHTTRLSGHHPPALISRNTPISTCSHHMKTPFRATLNATSPFLSWEFAKFPMPASLATECLL